MNICYCSSQKKALDISQNERDRSMFTIAEEIYEVPMVEGKLHVSLFYFNHEHYVL
jgi:hypothetical protein